MPVYKLDLVFEAKGRGWEETYYRNFPQTDFGSAVTVVTTLAQKRIKLSANPVEIKAYRISDPISTGRQGQAIYFNPTINPGGAGGEQGAVAPSASINVNWIHNAGNLTRQIQMRGVWDAAITNFNDLSNADFANWFEFFKQYRTYVLNQGFGWMNLPRAGTSQVSYAFVGAATTPTFTTPNPFWPEPQINTFQKARFSRFNGSNSPLNREIIVYVTSTTQCTAALPIAAGPQTAPGRVIRYGDPVFVAADNIGVTRVGRRSPGAPLLYTPGRARKRARS